MPPLHQPVGSSDCYLTRSVVGGTAHNLDILTSIPSQDFAHTFSLLITIFMA